MTSTFDDEIVEEIRRRREAHAITEDLQCQERESGTPVVRRPPRTPHGLPKRGSVGVTALPPTR
jgi:hypothetical protein